MKNGPLKHASLVTEIYDENEILHMRRLPQSSLQALVGDAARTVNMDVLLRLERAGAFELMGPADQINSQHLPSFNFHKEQFSLIAALACVTQGILSPKKFPKILDQDGVVRDGNGFGRGFDALDPKDQPPPLHHQPFMTLDRGRLGGADGEAGLAAFSELIGRQVNALCELAKKYKTAHSDAEMDPLVGRSGPRTFNFFNAGNEVMTYLPRMRATLEALLCASIVLGDAALAKTICKSINHWCRPLRDSGVDDLIKPVGMFAHDDAVAQWLISPAYLALCFDQHEILDTMASAQFPIRTAIFKVDCNDKGPAPPFAGDEERGPSTAKGLAKNSETTLPNIGRRYTLADVLIHDRAIKLSLPTCRHVLGLLKTDQAIFTADCAEPVRRWGQRLLDRSKHPEDMAQMALQAGVYHIDKKKSYDSAVHNGNFAVVQALGPQLDWSVYTPISRPIDLALESSMWAAGKERMAEVNKLVMRQAVSAGRGDLLAEPGFFMGQTHFLVKVPLHDCIALGFREGVVMCLEQGADPRFEGNDNLNAFQLAEKADDDGMLALIQSVLARKEAIAVLGDIDSDKNDQKVKREKGRKARSPQI